MAPYPPSLHSRHVSVTWPVIVEGVNRGFEWREAQSRAGADLYRLCALLSVAWERCWLLREPPAPLEWGRRSVPERSPFDIDFLAEGVDGPPPTLVEPPGWIEHAWTVSGTDQALGNALFAHYEGLRLNPEHPSFALVAFVSSIEHVGSLVTQQGSPVGANAKFRAGPQLVRDEDDVKELGRAFQRRSGTAHAGRLYGGENLFGLERLAATLMADAPSGRGRGRCHQRRQRSRRAL